MSATRTVVEDRETGARHTFHGRGQIRQAERKRAELAVRGRPRVFKEQFRAGAWRECLP